MDKEPSVAVVLPTYNGADYIEQTLESICCQTAKNITVYVRDDGSSDETLSVIDGFVKGHLGSISLNLLKDDKGNLGCPNSFYEIIRSIPNADYYAFCDQDDIWLHNKIERAISHLRNAPPKEPAVYYSSFEYRTPEGKLIRRARPQDPNTPLWKTLFYTPGLGFTIVFNNSAKRRFIDNVNCGNAMHDRWMLRCASALGVAVYDPYASAWHIRHENAVTAADNTGWTLFKNYLTKELYGNEIVQFEQDIQHFLLQFSSSLSNNQVKELSVFKKPSRSILDRLKKATFHHRLRPSIFSDLALRIIFLIGKS